MVNPRTLLHSLLFVLKPCPPWALLNTLAVAPTWPFQSSIGMSSSVAGPLASVLHPVIETFLVSIRSVHLRCTHGRDYENCFASDQFKKDPVRDALEFNSFVCAVLRQQHANFWTKELELAVFICKHLVGFKRSCISIFPHTIYLDSLPRQKLHHFGTSFIQGSQIPSGNSELGIGHLGLLGLHDLLDLGCGLAARARHCFLRLRGSQAQGATCILSKTATRTAYLWFSVILNQIVIFLDW